MLRKVNPLQGFKRIFVLSIDKKAKDIFSSYYRVAVLLL